MPATPVIAPFPATRLRRLRRTPALRALTAERHVSVENLIWPIFVTEVAGGEGEIPSMPGVDRLTLDGAKRAADAGGRRLSHRRARDNGGRCRWC